MKCEVAENSKSNVDLKSVVTEFPIEGDYTKERHANIGDMSVDEICEEIDKMRK